VKGIVELLLGKQLAVKDILLKKSNDT